MIWLFRSVLAFAFVYHGIWNLGDVGAEFWAQPNMLFPGWFRWPVGVVECVAGLLLLHPRADRAASFVLLGVMVGAILSNFHQGYSYKNLGVEVPIAYAVMLLAIGMRSFR
jgi:uncharacterized membrane protein YphA (DoxX/SURF4 family)